MHFEKQFQIVFVYWFGSGFHTTQWLCRADPYFMDVCIYLSIHTHIYIHICDVCVLISSAHTSLASNQWKHSGYSCFSNRLTTESLWQPVCPGLCLPLNMGFHFIASTLGKQKQQGNNNKKNLMLQPKLELLHKNRREAELLVWCFSSVYSNLN